MPEGSQGALVEEVAAFEAERGAHCGARHGIAVDSLRTPLHVALLSAGIGPGDEAITVPFSCAATAAAIRYAGARPVVVDSEPRSHSVAMNQPEGAITEARRRTSRAHLHLGMGVAVLGLIYTLGVVLDKILIPNAIEDGCL